MGNQRVIPLKKGITLLYQKRIINKSVCFQLYFNVGSANSHYQPGLLHFGEHLRANRTKTLSALEADELATKNSMRLNASTSLSRLVFYSYASKKKIFPAVQLLTQKMLCPFIDEVAFENEKKIICNEIEKTKDDDARNIYLGTMQTILKNPFYFSNNIGEKEDILAYTQQTVQEHISDIINSNNLIVTAAGNISLWNVKRLIRKYVYPEINTSSPIITKLKQEFEFYDKSNLTFNSKQKVASQITVSFPFEFKGKYYGLKEQLILNKYISYLFNTSAGLIHKKLRQENGLIYSGSASSISYKEGGYFTIQYKTNKEQINKSLEVLASSMKMLTMTKEKFQELKLRDKLLKDTSMPISLDATCERMFNNYNIYNKLLRHVGKRLFRKIKLDEINELINRIFSNNRVYVHIFGNVDEKEVYKVEQIENLFFGENTTSNVIPFEKPEELEQIKKIEAVS